MQNIMTPKHEKWDEFCEELAGSNYCDFTEDDHWKCNGTLNKSKEILSRYDVDIEASLDYFMENGGYCDCEVLFNVGRCDL